MFFKD